MSCSASKWECLAKMCSRSSRCCSVKRCGFGRLARYSRNLLSGVCDTTTAGSDTRSPPKWSEPSNYSKTTKAHPRHGWAFVTRCNRESSADDARQEGFLGGEPFLLGVVGPSRDLGPHASDES